MLPTARCSPILGLKAAYEKAQAGNGGRQPSQEQIMAALKPRASTRPRAAWTWPRGWPPGGAGNGYGTTKTVKGKITMVNVKHYPVEKVQPPPG